MEGCHIGSYTIIENPEIPSQEEIDLDNTNFNY
jgi:hypothetical protein